MKTKRNFTQKGITLIALVITIIVMLILVAVTITVAVNGGLFKHAGKAKGETENAIKDEQILADGRIKVDGKMYASIDDYLEGKEYDPWEEILEKANANPESMKHKDQKTSTLIGIGTDGKPVNMDYWNAQSLSKGWQLSKQHGSTMTSGAVGYMGNFDENGYIVGKVPQYIYSEVNNEFLPVVSMLGTFYGLAGLKIAPEIPTTVTSMFECFRECSNLTIAPEIPTSVNNLYGCFSKCGALKTAPPIIPSSVSNLTNCFYECGLLEGTIIINANVKSTYTLCFWDAAIYGNGLVVTGSSEKLAEIVATKSAKSNITIGN